MKKLIPFQAYNYIRISWLSLCFAATVFLLPSAAFAETSAPAGIWTDYAADSYAGGTGTADDPYRIETAQQLAKLSVDTQDTQGLYTKNVSYLLTADIDLSEHKWIPIGYGTNDGNMPNNVGSSSVFQGKFDGGSHKITGLFADERETGCVAGLFGLVSPDGFPVSLENVRIEDAVLYSDDIWLDEDNGRLDYASSGILAGKAYCLSDDEVLIKNCHVSGTITSPSCAGGLIGQFANGTIENCSADTTIKDGFLSGGLIGNLLGGTIKNSHAAVALTGASNIGGFVGRAYGAELYIDGIMKEVFVRFENCSAEGSVDGSWDIGGFGGMIQHNVSLTGCTTSCNVSTNDWNAGGFTGWFADAQISGCSASGNVTSSLKGARPKAGGFVGSNLTGAVIKNSYASGIVTSVNPSIPAGGFVGYDEKGTTIGCFFDQEKNPDLEGVGETASAGTNNIGSASSVDILKRICVDVYGGHANEWVIDLAATCTTPGSKSEHCSRCGETSNQTEIPKLGHTFADYHNNNDATCTENGTETSVCSRCSETDTRTIPESAKGHHTQKTNEKAASCTQDGNIAFWHCDACGKYFSDEACSLEISEEETVLTAAGHHAQKTNEKAASCTQDGNIAFWHCGACGKYFSDEACSLEISEEETVLTAVGHGETIVKNAKEPTETAEGYTGDTVCSVCGETLKSGSPIARLSNSTNTGQTEIKVSQIRLNKKKATLKYKKKLKLKVSIQPGNATNPTVKWSVSNKKYASVTKKGVVKAKRKGIGHTVKVYATAMDGSGKKAICKIKIK